MSEDYVLVEMSLDDYHTMCKYVNSGYDKVCKSRERNRAIRNSKNNSFNTQKPLFIIKQTSKIPSEEYLNGLKLCREQDTKSEDKE